MGEKLDLIAYLHKKMYDKQEEINKLRYDLNSVTMATVRVGYEILIKRKEDELAEIQDKFFRLRKNRWDLKS